MGNEETLCVQGREGRPLALRDDDDDEKSKVVKATRSDCWSGDDESDDDFLDNGDDFADHEGDDTRYVNLHESALHAPVCEGREEGPIVGLSSLFLQRHSD